MSYVIVSLIALAVSGLTLFSGFGLGTLLMPIFALFMPVEVAVAATAVVHLGNNVIKVSFFGRQADWGVVWRFAVPAVLAAFAGAAVLGLVAGLPVLHRYELLGRRAEISTVKIVISVMIFGFALVELLPALRKIEISRRYLPFGGILSGFFGGLSGHQGALRAAFLAKAGLSTESFVGTTAVASLGVDLARVAIYGAIYASAGTAKLGSGGWGLIGVAMVAAFIGVVIGKRLVEKVTMSFVQTLTGILLFFLALGLGSGLI